MSGQEEEAKAHFIYFVGPALGQIWIRRHWESGSTRVPGPGPISPVFKNKINTKVSQASSWDNGGTPLPASSAGPVKEEEEPGSRAPLASGRWGLADHCRPLL